jgi:hypothetical protein
VIRKDVCAHPSRLGQSLDSPPGTFTRTRPAVSAPKRAMNAPRSTRRAGETRLEPPRRREERRQVRRAEWDKGARKLEPVACRDPSSTASSSNASRANIAVEMRCDRRVLRHIGLGRARCRHWQRGAKERETFGRLGPACSCGPAPCFPRRSSSAGCLDVDDLRLRENDAPPAS